MERPEPRKEHQWLERMAGDWTFELEAEGPDGQTITDSGTEFVRSLDGLWVLAEGRGETPDGGEAVSIMTLGFDPAKGRFTGTFISSMMTHLWIYDGELDAAGRVLSLDTEGPAYDGEGMAKYRDTIELVDDGHRVHTSSYQREDGAWHPFMTVHYRRSL